MTHDRIPRRLFLQISGAAALAACDPMSDADAGALPDGARPDAGGGADAGDSDAGRTGSNRGPVAADLTLCFAVASA